MAGTRQTLLFSAALVVLACAFLGAGETDPLKVDEKTLEQANVKTDGPSLLDFFKQRTLNDIEMIQVESLVQQLGANSFAKREMATAKLTARGGVIVPILKKYVDHKDLELASRARKCLQHIKEKDHNTQVLTAAVRVLGQHKPEGAAAVLLDYLPFADNDTIAEEVRATLVNLAVRDRKAEPALVKGLKHKNPVIRSAAGEALALAGDKQNEKEVWKLLEDPDTLVRYRVALGLTLAENPKAVPVLIGLAPQVSRAQALQLEDLLLRMAKDNSPPTVTLGKTKQSLEEFSNKWSIWWKKHGQAVNLAGLKSSPKLLGYTLLVLLEAGQIIELGHNNEVRWQISNLNFPLDVQMLPNDRVLVAEYHGSKVTERDLNGDIKWHYNIFGPLAAQRLENGNTFIVTDELLVEIDKDNNKRFTHSFTNERVMKASKTNDGLIVCLTTLPRIVVIDDKGEELKKFNVNIGKPLFGGRLYTTPTGRVLVPHNAENKIVEYDLDGNDPWKLENIPQPVAAVRLPNGNTLVTTMDMPGKVIEFDRVGNEVWSYETKLNTKITRALRR